MTKVLVRYFFFLLTVILTSCLQEKGVDPGNASTFVRYFNGGNNDEAVTAQEIPDEGFILLGTTLTSDNLYKVKLVKTDLHGNLVWQSVFPPYDESAANLSYRARSLAVQKDANGTVSGYVIAADSIDAGGTSYPSVMISDTQGSIQMNSSLPAYSGVQAKAISLTNSGILILGINNESSSMVLASLELTNLNVNWVRTYPATGTSLSTRLFEDNIGNLFWIRTVSGTSNSDIRLVHAQPDTQNALGDESIGKTGYNEEGKDLCAYGSYFAITGTTNEKDDGSTGDPDILFTLVRHDGSVSLSRRYGLPNRVENANSINPTNDGGMIILATVETIIGDNNQAIGRGDTDFYLLKITNSGEVEWDNLLGSKNKDVGAVVRKCSDGGYLVFGTSVFDGLESLALIKTDATGHVE